MQIFPAIDLKNGQCVRLTQGDFNAVTIYESDPLKQAQKFADAGTTWLHMVDLDGAKDGAMQQFGIIEQIAKQTNLKIQVGGGIRNEATIQKLLDAGVTRVVIGSLAVKNPELVKTWLAKFTPEHIVLAFDVRINDKNEPEILTQGWQESSRESLWDILNVYQDSGLKTILCTDVGRDGMLMGTNSMLYRAVQQEYPSLNILASGGVGEMQDLLDLAALNLAGAITGKAIYEGKIDLAAAIKAVA